ncbi:unnamed protein product [Symbiodinium sp. KB8]|nr:unnamed protein product [Symbiodinium sp. KB8]
MVSKLWRVNRGYILCGGLCLGYITGRRDGYNVGELNGYTRGMNVGYSKGKEDAEKAAEETKAAEKRKAEEDELAKARKALIWKVLAGGLLALPTGGLSLIPAGASTFMTFHRYDAQKLYDAKAQTENPEPVVEASVDIICGWFDNLFLTACNCLCHWRQ